MTSFSVPDVSRIDTPAVFMTRNVQQMVNFYGSLTEGVISPSTEDSVFLEQSNSNFLKFINSRGVFENPEDLKNFQCEDGTCWNDSKPFPMPADMVQAITMGMASGELQLLRGTSSDTLADQAQDATTIGGAPPQQAKI